MLQFSQELRAYRSRHNVSQDALAGELGISQSALSRLENGKTEPSRQIIRRFCQLSGISESDFLPTQQLTKPVVQKIELTLMPVQKKLFYIFVTACTFYTHEFGFMFAGYATWYAIRQKWNSILIILSGLLCFVYLLCTLDIFQAPHVIPFRLFTPVIFTYK